MRARRQLQEIQPVDRYQLHTRKVAERLLDSMVFVVYDERASSHDISSVAHLPLAAPDLFGLLALLDVFVCVQPLQQCYGCFGLREALDGVCTHDWYFRDTFHFVSPSHQERGNGTGCQRRADGISSLLLVDRSMPSSPGFGGSKHASTSAHVTEGCLTRTVSTTASNTRNTGNSTSSTPGFSRRLVPSVLVDSVRLSCVLRHVGVDEVNDVGTNGSLEDCR